MFETVFAQACQLARTIGLHQTAAGAPQEAERRRLFWCLFIIDVSVHSSLDTRSLPDLEYRSMRLWQLANRVSSLLMPVPSQFPVPSVGHSSRISSRRA